MKHKLAFVLVIEAGDLELKSILLVNSIRNFAGQFKDSPIWVVQPRIGRNLSKATLDFLIKNDVIFLRANLNNKRWKHYGPGNKAYAAAFVESLVIDRFDTLVLLDSDTIICCPPDQLVLQKTEVVALRPADMVGVSLLANQPINDFWRIVYETCGTDKSQLWNVNTTVDAKQVPAYFNSGLVAVKPHRKIFQKYRDNMNKLAENQEFNNLPPESKNSFFIDQCILASTILANTLCTEVRLLDKKYNYPLNLHSSLPLESQVSLLNELVVIHYHHSFYNLKWKDFVDVKEPLQSWLLDRLPLPNLRKSRLHKMLGTTFINRTISRLS